MGLFLWPVSAQERDINEVTEDYGLIGPAEPGMTPFGWWCGSGLLDPGGPDEAARAARQHHSRRVVAAAGALPAGDDEDAARAALRTHSAEGFRALETAIERTVGAIGSGGPSLCVRPRAADVLSDVPSCLVFLRSAAAARARLVVDPIAMLTPSMAERAEEHLERIYEGLAGHTGVEAVVVWNAALGGDGALRPVGLHEPGLVDARWLVGLAARCAGPGVDWIILDREVEVQKQVLRMYGPGA